MIILLLVAIIILIINIDKYNDKKKKNNTTDNIQEIRKDITCQNIKNVEKEKINYSNYYKPKRYVITLNELNFYNTLMEIAKEMDLVVFSQVSLYNILETKDNLDYRTKTIYFNKIASKSIDFVLVNKKDCKIKLCIELDDNSHKQEKRIERDKFINELFKSLEINLLRYPTYKVYYKETLKKKIQEKMIEHYYNI